MCHAPLVYRPGVCGPAALRNRRHIFNSGPRRVSQVMVSALSAKPDLQGQAAARAWQRSAAGLWSSVLGGQKEAS